MELTSRGMGDYSRVWDLPQKKHNLLLILNDNEGPLKAVGPENSRRRVGNNKITDVLGGKA